MSTYRTRWWETPSISDSHSVAADCTIMFCSPVDKYKDMLHLTNSRLSCGHELNKTGMAQDSCPLITSEFIHILYLSRSIDAVTTTIWLQQQLSEHIHVSRWLTLVWQKNITRLGVREVSYEIQQTEGRSKQSGRAGRDQSCDKESIVAWTDTVVEPLAVVIKVSNALVARTAVFWFWRPSAHKHHTSWLPSPITFLVIICITSSSLLMYC